MRSAERIALVVLLLACAIGAQSDERNAAANTKEFRSVVATQDHARVLHVRPDEANPEDDTPYQFTYSAGRFPFHVDRTHSETKDDYGITRGAYSYVDPNRRLQTVRYEANKEEGFKVLSSTLQQDAKAVQDTPAVAVAKNHHRELFETIAREHARIGEEHARLALERAADAEYREGADDDYANRRPYGERIRA